MSEPRTHTDVCLCTGLALKFEGVEEDGIEIWDFCLLPAHATSVLGFFSRCPEASLDRSDLGIG